MGFGAASVRFICGTQGIHKTLEQRVSRFLGMEDTILYAACFDANTGLFETILGPEDAVISDELNHASIIDGVRLCSVALPLPQQRHGRSSSQVERSAEAVRGFDYHRRCVLNGGTIAQLDAICDLADQFGAMVHHDDCHATGFMGDKDAVFTSTAASWTGSTSSRVPLARRWAVVRWVYLGPSGDH